MSYTLLLGRRRQADDVVRLAPGQHVDDVFSAELNFAADKLDRDPDGAYRITVVRRARPANEGPDDVSSDGYRAELATARFHAAPGGGHGPADGTNGPHGVLVLGAADPAGALGVRGRPAPGIRSSPR